MFILVSSPSDSSAEASWPLSYCNSASCCLLATSRKRMLLLDTPRKAAAVLFYSTRSLSFRSSISPRSTFPSLSISQTASLEGCSASSCSEAALKPATSSRSADRSFQSEENGFANIWLECAWAGESWRLSALRSLSTFLLWRSLEEPREPSLIESEELLLSSQKLCWNMDSLRLFRSAGVYSSSCRLRARRKKQMVLDLSGHLSSRYSFSCSALMGGVTVGRAIEAGRQVDSHQAG